jgi:hypothetical protein
MYSINIMLDSETGNDIFLLFYWQNTNNILPSQMIQHLYSQDSTSTRSLSSTHMPTPRTHQNQPWQLNMKVTQSHGRYHLVSVMYIAWNKDTGVVEVMHLLLKVHCMYKNVVGFAAKKKNFRVLYSHPKIIQSGRCIY